MKVFLILQVCRFQTCNLSITKTNLISPQVYAQDHSVFVDVQIVLSIICITQVITMLANAIGKFCTPKNFAIFW